MAAQLIQCVESAGNPDCMKETIGSRDWKPQLDSSVVENAVGFPSADACYNVEATVGWFFDINCIESPKHCLILTIKTY